MVSPTALTASTAGGASPNTSLSPGTANRKREAKMTSKKADKIDRAIQSARLYIEQITDEDKENIDPERHRFTIKLGKNGKSASKSKKGRERPALISIGRTVLGPRI